jgi:hypothetical protein
MPAGNPACDAAYHAGLRRAKASRAEVESGRVAQDAAIGSAGVAGDEQRDGRGGGDA